MMEASLPANQPREPAPARRRFFELKERKPLNMGRSRIVFEHPDDPALVVKVMRPDALEERFGGGTAWYKRKRRFGHFISYIREIEEYVAVHAALGHNPPFLQTVVGFVDTDFGLGFVTEAARDRDGNLAPSLGTLIQSGRFDSTVREDLERFFEQVVNCDAIISDLNVGNLVYAFHEKRGNHFVLIDGLGNTNPLPFKALSQRINRRSKRRRFERLYSRIKTRLKNAGHTMPPLPCDRPVKADRS